MTLSVLELSIEIESNNIKPLCTIYDFEHNLNCGHVCAQIKQATTSHRIKINRYFLRLWHLLLTWMHECPKCPIDNEQCNKKMLCRNSHHIVKNIYNFAHFDHTPFMGRKKCASRHTTIGAIPYLVNRNTIEAKHLDGKIMFNVSLVAANQ